MCCETKKNVDKRELHQPHQSVSVADAIRLAGTNQTQMKSGNQLNSHLEKINLVVKGHMLDCHR